MQAARAQRREARPSPPRRGPAEERSPEDDSLHHWRSTSIHKASMSELLQLVRGCTFDDFLFAPQYSVIERRDPAAIDLSCQLSTHLRLRRPIVSANMDT